ncbi:MAG: hypothetical protein AAF414_15695 [Pseudomonadota bacterium]
MKTVYGMTAGDYLGFAISASICAAIFGATGVYVLRTLTLALEGHYEFKGDSLTKRSRLAGFARFFVWAVLAATAWSFFIDWIVFEDLDFAFAALAVRLHFIIEILSAMSDN